MTFMTLWHVSHLLQVARNEGEEEYLSSILPYGRQVEQPAPSLMLLPSQVAQQHLLQEGPARGAGERDM